MEDRPDVRVFGEVRKELEGLNDVFVAELDGRVVFALLLLLLVVVVVVVISRRRGKRDTVRDGRVVDHNRNGRCRCRRHSLSRPVLMMMRMMRVMVGMRVSPRSLSPCPDRRADIRLLHPLPFVPIARVPTRRLD